MAKLEVVGMNCRSCLALLKNVEEAVRLEGRADPVSKVSDFARILELNPLALPALAIDNQVVVAGHLPTTAEIRQLLVSTSVPSEPNAPNLRLSSSRAQRILTSIVI